MTSQNSSRFNVYVDTSASVNILLLDTNYNCIDHVIETNRRTGSSLQSLLLNLLGSNKLDVSLIADWFFCAGPGSYTGVRISEGFSQVLELEGKNVYSFFSYQIPQFLGVGSGRWIAKAFRGEFFVYSWNGSSNETSLINEDGLLEIEAKPFYFHVESPKPSLDVSNLTDTNKLIRNNTSVLFKIIKERKVRVQPMYYRAPELEFNPAGVKKGKF